MKRIAIILAIAVVAIFAARQAMAELPAFAILSECAISTGDFDGDGAPNGVDPDVDGDGALNDVDTCYCYPNPDEFQADVDGDGFGIGCDYCPNDPDRHLEADKNDCVDPDDSDADGILDDVDNCPDDPNPDQWDYDADGVGNACDDCAYLEPVTSTDVVDEFGCIIDDGDADADSADADDYDGDGVSDDDDECYDIEGVASCYGCPASYCEVYDFSDNIALLGDADSEFSQASAGGCSLTPAGSANKVSLLILALGLLPLAIRRKRDSQRTGGE